jgi:hypothetical protein
LSSTRALSNISRIMRAHGLGALAGFALGLAIFGLDDLERAGLWAQDTALALIDPPSLIATDEESGPNQRSSISLAFAKVEKNGVAPFAPRPYADDPLSTEVGTDRRYWSIPYWIDPAGLPPQMPKDRAIALVVKAADAWRPCGARFSYQGERSKAPYGSYGPGEEPTSYPPIVGWMNLPEKISGLTLTESDTRTGQIERWTMDIDPESSTTTAELLSTATHEFGHVVGLNHARDIHSIMFGGPNPKVLRPTAADMAECQRVISTWNVDSAADMASPLGLAIAETLSGAAAAASASAASYLTASSAQERKPRR